MIVDKVFVPEFLVSEEEYAELEDKFVKLCHFQAWQLDKNNSRITEEQEDFVQELKLSLLRAAYYHKRQLYIEESFEVLKEFVNTQKGKQKLDYLINLWENRTRHGANKQKFGDKEEKELDNLVKKFIPVNRLPSKKRTLTIDPKFTTYCKAITWNTLKALGKKITKEKSWRSGLVSLSEYDYLGEND